MSAVTRLMLLFVYVLFWKRQCDGNGSTNPGGQAGKRSTQQISQQKQVKSQTTKTRGLSSTTAGARQPRK